MKFVNPSRTRSLIRLLITVIGSLYIIVPVLLLYFLQARVAKLVVVVVALVLFAGVMAAMTTAKNWEVLAASVA